MSNIKKGLLNQIWTLLHWVAIDFASFCIFCLQYVGMKDTGSHTGGFLPVGIYKANYFMLIIGFSFFCIAYAFAWKYWLKKDLVQNIKLHWGWCIAFGVLTLFGMFWMCMNIAFAPMAISNSFIELEGRTEVIFFVQLFFVIAYPVAEYFITKKKQGVK